MAATVTFETLWEKLNLNQNELLERLQGLDNQMTHMNGSMNALNEQISEIQTRVSRAEDNLESTDNKVVDLTKRVEYLETKVEYLENKSRQNNVVLFGFPEGEEKSDTVAFINLFLTETLRLPRDLHIERAHRIPARAPAGSGRKPRPIIARFGDYQQKTKVMALVREKGTLQYKDNRVFLYQDFSAEVQRKRQQFGPAKKKLHARGIRYAMLFPAILLVDYMGARKRFENPLDVETFLYGLDNSSASST